MKTYKLIVTSDNILSKLSTVKYNLSSEFENLNFNLFISEDNKNNEGMILLLIKNQFIEKGIDYIFDNYCITTISILKTTEKYYNFDYNIGDVIIPNTFISGNGNDPIFLDPTIGENYDLKKFGLILNGICFSLKFGEKLDEKNIENSIDLIDIDTYFILEQINKGRNIENISVLELILGEKVKDDDIAKNLFLVLDLII